MIQLKYLLYKQCAPYSHVCDYVGHSWSIYYTNNVHSIPMSLSKQLITFSLFPASHTRAFIAWSVQIMKAGGVRGQELMLWLLYMYTQYRICCTSVHTHVHWATKLGCTNLWSARIPHSALPCPALSMLQWLWEDKVARSIICNYRQARRRVSCNSFCREREREREKSTGATGILTSSCPWKILSLWQIKGKLAIEHRGKILHGKSVFICSGCKQRCLGLLSMT